MIVFGLETLAAHPCLADNWYYVLPPSLLELLEAGGVNKRVDPSSWGQERELGGLAARLRAVGFRNGTSIIDEVLLPPADPEDQGVVSRLLDEWELRGDQRASFLKLSAGRTAFERETRQGFCGWLFTNPVFRSEFQTLQNEVPRLLRPDGEILLPTGVLDSVLDAQLIHREAMDLAPLSNFCSRWRLNSIVGPRTVVPQGRQDVSGLTQLDAARARAVGRLSFSPDISRLPPRDELRDREEESIRSTARNAPHLREWVDLVESNSQGKKSIARWARIYRLQHYWRVFHERHGTSLNRLGAKVREAFAQWLAISRARLDDDINLMRNRLGSLN